MTSDDNLNIGLNEKLNELLSNVNTESNHTLSAFFLFLSIFELEGVVILIPFTRAKVAGPPGFGLS